MMNNLIDIMSTWKEFNPEADKSMKDDFQSHTSPFQQKIVNYLNNGKLSLAAASCGKDIFTGERIVRTYGILTDDEFSWVNTLGHYVQKYNLKLPQEFEKKIIDS